MSLLQMSFSGAALILVIAVIWAAAIHILPKKTFLILWGIVLLRLLIPFSIPSIFNVYSLLYRNIDVKALQERQRNNIIPVMYHVFRNNLSVLVLSISVFPACSQQLY